MHTCVQQRAPHLCCSYQPHDLFIVGVNPACVYGHWQVKTQPNQVRSTPTRDSICRGLPFQMINGTSLYEFACVFWDYELNDWSTDGCSKGNTSDGFLRCFCNHTTNFAALWVMINFRGASHIIKGLLKKKKKNDMVTV